MQPAEWHDAWGHRIVTAPIDDRLLPAASREFLLKHGMPRNVVFEWRNPFEISFAPLSRELVPYNTRVRWGDFYDEAQDRNWSQQVVIADEDFCNGSASYCVHNLVGKVSRIDCELSNPQRFVNSSVAQFGMSLLVAKRWSANLVGGGVRPCPDSLKKLARQLENVDRPAFGSEECFWRFLVEAFDDPEVFEIVITDDPAHSQPRF